MRLTTAICLICLCATASADGLKLKEIENVKKVAVNAIPAKGGARLVAKKGFWGGVGGLTLGIVGAEVDPFFGSVTSELELRERKAEQKRHPKTFSEMLKEFPISDVFDSVFCDEFGILIETVCPKEVDSLGIEFPPFYRGRGLAPNNARKDYRPLKKEINADLVFEIKYIFGFARYGKDEDPAAIVCVDVIAVETNNNKLLKSKSFRSDDIYTDRHSNEEFLDGGEEFYRNEICNAIKGLCKMIVTEFELPTGSKNIN